MGLRATKLDEIQQRHANGYKGIDAERVFPDVAALLSEVGRLQEIITAKDELLVAYRLGRAESENEQLRAALKELLRYVSFDSPEHHIVINALSRPSGLGNAKDG